MIKYFEYETRAQRGSYGRPILILFNIILII